MYVAGPNSLQKKSSKRAEEQFLVSNNNNRSVFGPARFYYHKLKEKVVFNVLLVLIFNVFETALQACFPEIFVEEFQ